MSKHNTQNKQNLSFNSYWLDFIGTCIRPMVKILVKNKVEFKSFSNLLREIYVEEGENHINKVSSNSRGKISSIAHQTGLDRREVSAILKAKDLVTHTNAARSREGNILDHWVSNPPFCDDKGNPTPLKRSGSGLSFEVLTQRFGKNISHGPILESLIEAGCVEIKDNKVHLIKKSFVPKEAVSVAKIEIAANSIKRLTNTIAHNFDHENDTNFQRNLFSIQIPEEHIPAFRHEVTEMMKALYEDTITTKFEAIEDKYASITVPKNQNRIGLGFFYFDENQTLHKTFKRN
ncbi:DUF6502 family protein [Marinicella sp. S1101]|uniref:DUF6502 family protein n=1 Tax=Marinicella marina TaxID=2996016 RepID=UPI0022608748|nr:DUF6502 family protein [Marinicella marina]MCX7554570.1 DUF6502 family protein [Marinicella marina]MDJ1141046.1 DUF6502 family protein [Marinicella marina]